MRQKDKNVLVLLIGIMLVAGFLAGCVRVPLQRGPGTAPFSDGAK